MKQFNKAAIILITMLSTASYCKAQGKWSAGYQAGLGTLNVNSDKVALTNQAFINRKISRRIEVEASFGYTSWNEDHINQTAGWPDGYRITRYTCNLTITAKYYWLQKNKWACYIPLAISNAYIHTHSIVPGDLVYGWFNYTEENLTMAYCVSSGVGGNISINKHFFLNAQCNAGLKTRKAFGSFDTRHDLDGNALAYGVQTGIGYRFQL